MHTNIYTYPSYIYIYSIANTTTPKVYGQHRPTSPTSEMGRSPVDVTTLMTKHDKTSMFAGSIPGAPVFVLIFAGKCWWLPWIFAGQILTNPIKRPRQRPLAATSCTAADFSVASTMLLPSPLKDLPFIPLT